VDDVDPVLLSQVAATSGQAVALAQTRRAAPALLRAQHTPHVYLVARGRGEKGFSLDVERGTSAPLQPLWNSRAGHCPFIQHGQNLCILGGHAWHMTTIEAYDLARETWRAPRGLARTPFCERPHAAVSYGGRVYAVGKPWLESERERWYWSDSELMSWDPEREQPEPAVHRRMPSGWRPQSSLPTERTDCVMVVCGDRIWTLGGFDARHPVWRESAHIEGFDPVSETWFLGAYFPIPAKGLAAVAHEGKIYVIGGITTGCNRFRRGDYRRAKETLELVHCYDPASDSWSTKAPLKTKRAYCTAISVGRYIYALGGVDPYTPPKGHRRTGICYDPPPPVRTIERYDPQKDAWEEMPLKLPDWNNFHVCAAA